MYNPIFLNQNISKEELRQKYVQLYESVYTKLDRVDSGFAAQLIYMQEEMLNVYRKLCGRTKVKKLKELQALHYEIQQVKDCMQECKIAIEELKKQ
jgi:hypothetical protein